jgi:hypothetical protein
MRSLDDPPPGFKALVLLNPTDRAKGGTKRSVLVDGAGAPLGLAIAGANVPDKWLVEPTLARIGLSLRACLGGAFTIG